MKRINDRTVELTDEEADISDLFEDLLDQGYSIPAAVSELRTTTAQFGPDLSDEFWRYLSQ